MTKGDFDRRQANKPLCWTPKRFDVRTGADYAVSLSVIAIFVNGDLNFPEAFIT